MSVSAFTRFTAILPSFIAFSVHPAAADAPAFRWVRGGHGGPVTAVAVSPTDPIAASSSADGTVKIWRLSDGRLRRTLVPQPDQVFGTDGVLFSRDGTLVAGAGTGGAVLWRVADGQYLHQLGQMETGYGLAFSPDDQFIAVAGSIDGLEEATRVFRVADGLLIRTLIGPDNFYALSAAFAPDGQTLFVARGSPFGAGADGAITQYRLSDGAIVRTLTGHTRRVGSISLSPDGATLASGGEDATIRFWRVSDGAPLGLIAAAHSSEVNSVAYSPDGASLVSAGLDGRIRLWRTTDRALLATVNGHVGSVSSAAWTVDSQRLLSAGGRTFGGSGDATVRLWDAASHAQLSRFTDFTSRGPIASYAPDSARVAVADGDDPMQIFDATAGRLLRTITPPAYTYTAALSPDGTRLAGGSFPGTVRLWNVTSGAVYATITLASSGSPSFAFTPDGQSVVAGNWNDGLRLYRSSDGGFVRFFASSINFPNSIVFSADGTFMAAAGGSSALLWRVSDGSVVRGFPGAQFSAQVVALTEDASMLAIGGSGPEIRIFRVSDGGLIRTLTGPQWRVGCLAFSPDGGQIAAGSSYYDHTIRVWTVADGIERGVIDEQNGTGAVGLRFVDGGRSLLVSRDDGVVGTVRNPAFPACPADVDADGVIDLADLARLLSQFGVADGASPATGDLDDDGDVDLADLAALLASFGGECP